MNWENVLKEIIVFFAGTSILVSTLVVLVKYLFEHLLAKDLDKFKADISLEIEKYKSQLEKENIRHSIQYSKLHVDRAEIIKELYSKINDIELSLEQFISFLKNKDNKKFKEKGRLMIEIYTDYKKYYKKNKIFFDPEQCFLMQEIESVLKTFLSSGIREKTWDERKLFWYGKKTPLLDNINLIKTRLENDFREILGVELGK